MKREQEHRIVDRQRIEGLLEIGKDRRPRRDEVGHERPLVREHLEHRHIVNRAIGRLKPRQTISVERAKHVLRGRDGNVALVGGAAE